MSAPVKPPFILDQQALDEIELSDPPSELSWLATNLLVGAFLVVTLVMAFGPLLMEKFG